MAMLDRVVPVLQAVAHGAWDSCENLALNIRDKLPIRRAERLGPCLNGKVRRCSSVLRAGRPQQQRPNCSMHGMYQQNMLTCIPAPSLKTVWLL
jgi:hypothetical protein